MIVEQYLALRELPELQEASKAELQEIVLYFQTYQFFRIKRAGESVRVFWDDTKKWVVEEPKLSTYVGMKVDWKDLYSKTIPAPKPIEITKGGYWEEAIYYNKRPTPSGTLHDILKGIKKGI